MPHLAHLRFLGEQLDRDGRATVPGCRPSGSSSGRGPIQNSLYPAADPACGLGLRLPDWLEDLHHQSGIDRLHRQIADGRIDVGSSCWATAADASDCARSAHEPGCRPRRIPGTSWSTRWPVAPAAARPAEPRSGRCLRAASCGRRSLSRELRRGSRDHKSRARASWLAVAHVAEQPRPGAGIGQLEIEVAADAVLARRANRRHLSDGQILHRTYSANASTKR